VDRQALDGGRLANGPTSGMTVGGRYRFERKIASGAMGHVWLGVHADLQLKVALKTLRVEMAANHEVAARFSREAFLLGRIQSDHVVRVLDFMADRRLGPVLVTEYVDGPSLAAVLRSRRLTVEGGIDLAIDLVTGLRELHRAHIVHRDVKPANVVMRRLGPGEHRAVFVDLGVSRLVPQEEAGEDFLTEITTLDRAVGTVEYMAPEQVFSSRTVTAPADLYSVGAILYRAVGGRHAFEERDTVDLVKRKLSGPAPPLDTGRTDRVARGFEEIVARVLSPSADERYENADEMLADLALLRDAARRAARSSLVAPPKPPVPGVEGTRERTLPSSAVRPRRAPARGRWVRAALCVLAGLLVGSAAGACAVWRADRATAPRVQTVCAPAPAPTVPAP
jgi:serine/threonine-protein kinase